MMSRSGRLIALLALVSALWGCSAVSAQAPSQPLVEPDAGRQPIQDFISSAQSTVDLAIYELTDTRILSALEGDAGRGIRVRVLAEPSPGGHPVNAHALSELQARGVLIRDSSPRFRLTHEKTLVVDGSSALIMSLNLVAQTFSASRDVAVFDTDPADVAEVESVFEADWNRQPVAPSRPSLVWSPDNARGRIEATLNSAREEIDLYAEELLDREVVGILAAQAGAGLRVRLIMSDTGNRDSSRPNRALLASAGGDVRLLERPYIHAKLILVDGSLAFVGSENLSEESLDRNRELGLLSSDPSIVGRLSDIFEQDWQRAAPLSN